MSNCLTSLLELAKESIPEATKRTLRDMDERFERIKQQNPDLSAAELNGVMHMLVENELMRIAERTKAARLIDLEVITKGSEMLLDTSTGQSLGDNAIAFVSGTSARLIKGGNRGVRAVAKGIEGRFLGQLFHAVRNDLKVLSRGAIDRELTLEMSGVDSGSPTAARIAKMYNKIMTKLFDMKKGVNPFLEKIEDYTHRQNHNRDKIVKAGFEEWSNFILANYGKKSFPDLSPAQVQERLLAIFDSIKADEYSSTYLKDPGNKLRQMARERVLLPNDAEAFYKYHTLFGEGTIFDVMVGTIQKAANDISQIERFGTNPVENIKKVFRLALKNADEKQRASYIKLKSRIDANVQHTLGFSSVPAKTVRAKAVQFILQAQVIAKLPLVALSLVDDITRAMAITRNTLGTNPISNLGNLTYHYMRSFISEKSAVETAPYVWIFVDSYLGKLSQDLGTIENAPGVMGRMMKFMSKANFADAHHRAARTSVGITVAKALAANAQKNFADLDPVLRQHGLQRYGAGAAEWKLINYARETIEAEGLEMPFDMDIITPEAFDRVPDSAVTEYLVDTGKIKKGETATKAEIDAAKNNVSNTVGGIINDLADAGSSSSGSAEYAFLLRGTDINSGLGQTLRLFSQFASVQVKNFNTTKRVLSSGADANKRNYAGAALLVGGGATAYAMKQFARAMLSNQTPPDPTDPEFILGALASGVGGSPISDALVHTAQSDFNPYLSKLQYTASLAGPAVGDALDVGTLAFSTMDALFSDKPSVDAQGLMGQVARIAEKTPFAAPFKLPYTKNVMEYYLFNELRQWGNPKYLRNQEKRMKKSDESGFLTEQGLWPEREYFILDPRNK